jgi:hypothetical protein
MSAGASNDFASPLIVSVVAITSLLVRSVNILLRDGPGGTHFFAQGWCAPRDFQNVMMM